MIKTARENFLQAYPNAPWRGQLQVIGAFALAIIIIALLAGVYLNVSVQAANLGRQTQEIQVEILSLQRTNADLETRLAELTSAAKMEKRAGEMGFNLLSSYDLVYLPVPGYSPKDEAVLAPPPGPAAAGDDFPPELNQTLFDWLQEEIFQKGTLDQVTRMFGAGQTEEQPVP